MSRQKVVLILSILCLLAAVLRIGLIVQSKAYLHPNAMEHSSIARFLVAGEGFKYVEWNHNGPSSVQSPPYPFLLASLFWTFGTDEPADKSLSGINLAYFVAMLINVALGVVAVWLTFKLAREMGASDHVGLLAAAGCAVLPTQVYSASHAQAICMITVCVTAMVLLFNHATRTGAVGSWIGFSLIGCLAALTEPVVLPAMALTGLIILAWSKLEFKTRFRNALILLGAALLIIGPWQVRNRIVHGKWMPIKSTFWVNVWKGNNDYATGTDRLPLSEETKKAIREGRADARDPSADGEHQYEKLTPQQVDRLLWQNDSTREDAFKEWASAWIKADPMRYVRMCFKRLWITVWIDWDNPKAYEHPWLYIAQRLPLLVGSIVGLLLALRLGLRTFFAILLIVTALLTYSMTVTAARFAIPFEPLQLIFVGLMIAWLLRWPLKQEVTPA